MEKRVLQPHKQEAAVNGQTSPAVVWAFKDRHKYNQEIAPNVEQNRYGANISLIKEQKQFQFSLLNKRRTMPFIRLAMVSYNNGPPLRHTVQATQGRIRVGAHIYPLTHNTSIQGADNQVTTILEGNLEVKMNFDSVDDQRLFVRAVGDTNELSSSENPSPDREI